MTPLPPTDPRYYAVRFILPTFPRTVTVSHANPMARLGVMAYGLAQFTSYGYTAGFDKQSGTSHCFVPDLWEERVCVKVWTVRDWCDSVHVCSSVVLFIQACTRAMYCRAMQHVTSLPSLPPLQTSLSLARMASLCPTMATL